VYHVKYRVIYAVLWLLTVVAFSVPWARFDDETYIGWRLLIFLPFSTLMYAYLLGMLIGLMVLTTRPITQSSVVKMTIMAGGLMIFGLVGAFPVYMVAEIFHRVTIEAGMGFAFIASMLYMIAGAHVGRRMVQRKWTRKTRYPHVVPVSERFSQLRLYLGSPILESVVEGYGPRVPAWHFK